MRKRPTPPLKALVALEAVVRHGSVMAAAAELCVTHGAISKHLAALEDWLGLPLFSDNRRRMVPTEVAITLAQGVEVGLEAIGSSLDAVMPEAPIGKARETTFEIVASATFAMHWLIPRLPDLKRSGFNLQARVHPTHAPVDWRDLTWDIAIRSEENGFPPSLTAIRLFRDRLGLFVSPVACNAAGHRELRDLIFLESKTRPGELDTWLDAAGLMRSKVRTVEPFEHNYIAIEAAASGQGAIVAPVTVIGRQIERGTLTRIAPHIAPAGPTFSVLFHPDSEKKPHAWAFTSWLRRQIEAVTASPTGDTTARAQPTI